MRVIDGGIQVSSDGRVTVALAPERCCKASLVFLEVGFLQSTHVMNTPFFRDQKVRCVACGRTHVVTVKVISEDVLPLVRTVLAGRRRVYA